MSDQAAKPALDEATFQKVLEAAYVLQEHKRKKGNADLSRPIQPPEQPRSLKQPAPKNHSATIPGEASRRVADYTLTLAEIVEAQHQIQARHLCLEEAMAVVAEKLAQITGANGAGVGMLEGSSVCYRAAAGSSAVAVGTDSPLSSAVCQATIRTGQVIRTGDVNTEFLFDPELVRQRGIHSLLAVPIHYDGKIVGGLELYFAETHGYAEQDVHTCQLMAGLITEAMGREAGAELKKSFAAERSSMMAAIEKLQPNLAELAAVPAAPVGQTDSLEKAAGACSQCGNALGDKEQFCGKCGTARNKASGQTPLSSSAANAPFLPDASFAPAASENSLAFTEAEAEALAKSLSPISESDTYEEVAAAHEKTTAAEGTIEETGSPSAELTVPSEDRLVWTSAARAQHFLESLHAGKSPGALVRFWQSRRGDFYLTLSILLVVIVVGWGLWSGHTMGGGSATPYSKNARSKTAGPDANLSAFDKVLISVGLAEAPETPQEYKGNPDIQVWVDLNTAEYYCPGSDLYGKTAKGKFSTQREAQMDQFEPAYRKTCE